MPTTAKAYYPSLTLEVACGIDLTADPAPGEWFDISDRLRSFTVEIGRQRELDLFQAGRASFVLDNQDYQLDPSAPPSDDFGPVTPMMHIRFRPTWPGGGTTYDIFRGFTDSFPQSFPGQGADSVVTLSCFDALSVLALSRLRGSVWETTIRASSPSAWYRFGETSGSVMGDSSGNGKHGVFAAAVTGSQTGLLPYSGTDGSLEFDGIDDMGSTTLAAAPFDYTDTTQSVEFWFKTQQVPTGLGATVLKFFRAGSGVGTFTFIVKLGSDGKMFTSAGKGTDAAVNDNQVHHLVVSRAANVDTVYLDGIAQTTSGLSMSYYEGAEGTAYGNSPEALPGDGTEQPYQGFLDEIVWYDTALSSSDAADHYEAGANPWDGDSSGTRLGRILDEIGWSATLRDIDTGESVLGPTGLDGTALDYGQKIGQTEDGLFFVTGAGKIRLVGRGNFLTESEFNTSAATFADDGSAQKYQGFTIDQANAANIKNFARASRQGGAVQEYEDTTSSAQYGLRDVDLTGLLMNADSAAYDRAVATVLRFKDKSSRVDSLVLMPRRDTTNLFPKILAYGPGQRITVKFGALINLECHIEGIRHEGNGSQMSWTTTYQLSPTDPNEDNWFRFDSGVFDTNLFAY